ncbi:hypothetical protein [Paraburkholderia sp. GAS32]|uniref:hypothetical protein n=1 Tax=Paraburkholderia sp. GAS32 TaxID=3035129 RepID=UPI003D1E94E9
MTNEQQAQLVKDVNALKKNVPGDFLGDPKRNPTMALKIGYNEAIEDVGRLLLALTSADQSAAVADDLAAGLGLNQHADAAASQPLPGSLCLLVDAPKHTQLIDYQLAPENGAPYVLTGVPVGAVRIQPEGKKSHPLITDHSTAWKFMQAARKIGFASNDDIGLDRLEVGAEVGNDPTEIPNVFVFLNQTDCIHFTPILETLRDWPSEDHECAYENGDGNCRECSALAAQAKVSPAPVPAHLIGLRSLFHMLHAEAAETGAQPKELMPEVHSYDERISFSSAAYNAGFAITLYIDGGQRSTEALDSLNRVLDRPFGTISLAVRALVFALYQGGYPIQWRHHDGAQWYETPACFTWRGDVCYRVTPAPSLPPAEPKPDGDGGAVLSRARRSCTL